MFMFCVFYSVKILTLLMLIGYHVSKYFFCFTIFKYISLSMQCHSWSCDVDDNSSIVMSNFFGSSPFHPKCYSKRAIHVAFVSFKTNLSFIIASTPSKSLDENSQHNVAFFKTPFPTPG